MIHNMVTKAMCFAADAHEGQYRKYTGEPYITHPFAVAGLVISVTSDPEIISAALLHDTVEDTHVTLLDIEKRFGPRVRDLVENLTDISTHADGNRKFRVAMDRAHTKGAHPDAKTIKLADVANNLKNISDFGLDFAKQYMGEKKLLLAEALQEGHPALKELVARILDRFEEEHG